MNYKDKLLYCLLLNGIFSLCYYYRAIGQEKVNMSVGIGLPELLNVDVRFQLKQVQIGISIGSLPIEDESLISVSGDVYYHFGGLSKLSDRRPWYGRIGLNYLRDEPKTFVDKYLYLNLRFGRDFNISKKFGIEIDGGTMFQLYHQKIDKSPPSDWNLDFNFPVLPGIGVALFYRL